MAVMRTFKCLFICGFLIIWLICGVQCSTECCRKTDLIYFLNSTPQGCTRTCSVGDMVIIDEDGGLSAEYVKSYKENLLTLMKNCIVSCLANCPDNVVSVQDFTCKDECFDNASKGIEDETSWTSMIAVIAIIIIIMIMIFMVYRKRDFFRKLCCKTSAANRGDPELGQALQSVPSESSL